MLDQEMCTFGKVYLKRGKFIPNSKIIFRRCNIYVSISCAILKRNILYATLLINCERNDVRMKLDNSSGTAIKKLDNS